MQQLSSKLIEKYSGKNVLVAGASGMVGRNLYEFMFSLNAHVIGTSHSRDNFHKIDFTDSKQCESFFSRLPFDYVFICCAKTYNAFVAKENPQSMILPNIQMTSNILEQCLKNNVKNVCFISSATAYQPTFKRLSEEDMDFNQNPHELYMGVGWAKRYLEKLCEFYSGLGMNVTVVRPSYIYGKYDKTNEKFCHALPALVMRALRKENPYTVYGNGYSSRDFLFVNDFVRDLAKVAAFYKSSDPINLCSGHEYNINDLVKIILQETGFAPELKFVSDGIEGVPPRRLNRTKLDTIFGIDEYTTLEEGIKEVIEWYSSLLLIQEK